MTKRKYVNPKALTTTTHVRAYDKDSTWLADQAELRGMKTATLLNAILRDFKSNGPRRELSRSVRALRTTAATMVSEDLDPVLAMLLPILVNLSKQQDPILLSFDIARLGALLEVYRRIYEDIGKEEHLTAIYAESRAAWIEMLVDTQSVSEGDEDPDAPGGGPKVTRGLLDELLGS